MSVVKFVAPVIWNPESQLFETAIVVDGEFKGVLTDENLNDLCTRITHDVLPDFLPAEDGQIKFNLTIEIITPEAPAAPASAVPHA